MAVGRIHRRRVAEEVELAPSRVRRVRPSPAAEVGRVRRVRPAVKVGAGPSGRPFFVVDWERPLSWKFSIYMVTSFLYYQLNRSLIVDHDFDRLCKELGEGYDDFDHQHKHLVDRDQFIAGTGYAVKYPQMVKGAAQHMLDNFSEV